MQNRISMIFLILIFTTTIISCSNSKVNKPVQTEPMNEEIKVEMKAGPKVIIYKTKADYSKNVPITLSEDKSEVKSYPDIKDVFYRDELAYPTVLNGGFLLDNRGIDQNVAFLKYTYEQYSKMKTTPTSAELFENILDKDPLTEMYYCGSKYDYKDLETELNELIDSKKLNTFQKLK